MRKTVMKMGISDFVTGFKAEVEKAQTIAVSAHTNADGDAVGSTLAMGALLEKMGKTPHIFVSFKGDKYSYIMDKDKLCREDKETLSPDLFIALDCGTPERLADLKQAYDRARVKINIDHHISNESLADLNLVMPESSSTCELVYEIASRITEVDKYMAECLYTGLITDTSAFKHSSTGKRTMEVAGELMSKGIDFTDIQARMLYRHDMAAAKVFAKAVLNARLKDKIAYTTLSLSEIRSVGAIFEQLDGIAEYCLNTNGAVASAFLYEKGNGIIKCSFRSNGVDVNKVASTFGGGGHVCAAGCTLEETTLDRALKAVYEKLKEEVENNG